MNQHLKHAGVFAMFLLLLSTNQANAAISSQGVMDDILSRYSMVASGWETTISAFASRLFWTLALISMVWTFGMMVLRQADMSEVLAEFLRFTMFTGFYWWLLSNGPTIAIDIMTSMRKIGAAAAGTGSAITPSGIVDIGFSLFINISNKSAIFHPVDYVVAIFIGAVILVILALISINMLLMLISSWILAYAGIFFLGFGGSRWTSEMALSYFRTVLSTGAQLLTMVLLVGIGKTFLDTYYLNMSGVKLPELGIILVVSVVLLVLVNKLPTLVGGLAMGGGTGALGGGFGARDAVAAATMAGATLAAAGAALTTAAANVAGGVQALMAAISKGSEAESQSGSMDRDFTGGQSGSEAPSGGNGESTFAHAMGNDSSQTSEKKSKDSSTSSSRSGQKSRDSKGESSLGGSAGTSKAVGRQQAAGSSGSARSTRVAAGAAGSLVGGIAQVAKNSFNARVANTLGGKVAQAIRDSGKSKASDSANSLSAGRMASFDPDAEVAAFRNKDMPEDEHPDPDPSRD